MNAPHKAPDCGGRWQLEEISGDSYWRCQGCRALGYHCHQVAEAVMRENRLGSMLLALAGAGQKMPESEGHQR